MTQDQYAMTMRLFQFTCLRTLWIYDCEYVWSRHRVTAVNDGIDDEDLLAVATGPSNSRLEGLDRVFADAADELHYDHRLSDETWSAISAYHPDAVGDVIGAYVQYVLMSTFCNSVGAVLEDDVEGYPAELKALSGKDTKPAGHTRRPATPGGYPMRLEPLDPVDYHRAQVSALKPLRNEKITGTKMMRTFIRFPRFVTAIAAPLMRLKDCALSARAVHVSGLRTAWLYGCETLWDQERSACLELGLSESDIFEVAVGPASTKLIPSDLLIVRAMDEFHNDGWLSDATWNEIVKFGEEAPLDLIGAHILGTLIATMANTLGVELEDGASGFSTELLALMEQDAGR
ncbi:MAG: hypothetical protein JKY45_14665 [Emcibacter sp.]|nr:hypothetical protein [Emcibacter sp.]